MALTNPSANSNNPFSAAADRLMPSPVKARLAAAEKRRSNAEEAREQEKTRLSKLYHLRRQEELDAALAGADGETLKSFLARLGELTLESIPTITAFVRAGGLNAVGAAGLVLALRQTSERVVRLRTSAGMVPFDDALPGEPASAEQKLREEFADQRTQMREREPMNKLVEESAYGVPAQAGDRNPFTRYGVVAGGGGHIEGTLLKFTQGDYVAGKEGDEIPEGTLMIVGMDTIKVGWQKWQDGRVVDECIGLLIDGFVQPKREELGDNDKSLWETDDDGALKDLWSQVNFAQMIDAKDHNKQFTFTTSSKGGIGAIGKLCREYGRELDRGRDGQYPVVRLDVGSYAHKDRSLGRIKFPTFTIVDWVDKETLEAVKDLIGDEIPF
jgi:hypothetical protein